MLENVSGETGYFYYLGNSTFFPLGEETIYFKGNGKFYPLGTVVAHPPNSRFPEDMWSESKRIECPVSQRISGPIPRGISGPIPRGISGPIPRGKNRSQRIECPVSQRRKCPFSPETFLNVPFPIVPFPRLYKCRYLSFFKPLS